MATTKITKQERSEQTKTQLMEIALKQFAIHGFAGVALRDIAEEAQLNHAMIRYYFGDKENLWRESAVFLMERLAREVPRPSIESLSEDLSEIKAYIRNYVRYCARHPEHARFFIQESISSSERLKWIAETYLRPAHLQTLEIVKVINAKLGRPHVNPITLLYMITSMSQVPYMLAAEIKSTHNLDPMLPAAIESHADTVIQLLFKD
ncbi:TetR/AcrR family transcriptional regulator [Pseudomonas sp. GV071]|jgi:AcrR family transcriptional regulator|uniref:TetR/AcrR family transcriptional regulator n=1 Tax=Pseudomonas sp. GV071 TaxID=2135754 RepID=UPI000D343E34|nr:TetR/AcrR family transcriptional regulator [Pseudomonas sp. GV071]PTQ74346.1 TetR family transcriptional regulator [Pseudomonas sp. GV071]